LGTKNIEDDQMRQFASLGAKIRLQELDEERSHILATFPELNARRSVVADKVEIKKRKRATMSAQARREVSVRMKKYWVERRKAEAQEAGKAKK